jgi:hypothetical protein
MGHALREILGGFGKMPKTMVQLAAVQFFTWIALFAMWIYTTNGHRRKRVRHHRCAVGRLQEAATTWA